MRKRLSTQAAAFGLAVVLVLSAVAGLALLWSSDKEDLLARHIGAEMSDRDAARVQTLLRAF